MDYKQDYDKRSECNTSELKCENYLKSKKVKYIRYGFDKHINPIPKDLFWLIPTTIRKQPDFIVFQSKTIFLEVKGCKDILRVKIEDIKSYDFWAQIMPLSFFLYSSKYNQVKLVSFKHIKVLTTIAPIDRYPDNNKEYFKIDWGAID